MTDKLVYLESDEEITSVIDKISKTDGNEVVLVIPRGGNLAQSIVNLKLLKKRASDLGKDVSLVTTDKISRNLASQVGISVYSQVEEIGRRKIAPMPLVAEKPVISNTEVIKSEVPAPEPAKPAEELPEMPGIKIHRYYDEREAVKPDSRTADQDTAAKEQEQEIKAKKRENPTRSETELPTKEEASDDDVVKDGEENIGEKPQLDEVIELPEHPVIAEAEVGSQQSEDGTDSSDFTPQTSDGIQTSDKNSFQNRKMSVGEAIKKSRESGVGSRETDQESQPSGDQHHASDEKKPKLPGRRFKPMKKRRALAILIAAIVIIILAFGYLILPQAKATVTFKAESFDETTEVTVDKAADKVDPTNLVVPGTVSSVEKTISDKYSATGQKNIGNKATGKINLFNAGSSALQKINAGQGLSFDSKKFTLSSAVTIPGASVSGGNIVPGQVSADVTAADSGEVYNLAPVKSPNKFVLDGVPSTQTWAESSAAFSGGSTQNVKIVQASDISAAQEKIKTRLSAEAKDEVLKKVPSTQKYVDGTIEESITDLNASVPAGTQADDFTFSGKITMTVLTFDENSLKDMLVSKYQSKLASNRVLVQSDKIALDYTVTAAKPTLGTASYKVKLSGKISSKIDTGTLKTELNGKSLDEGKRILSALDLVKSVDIKMSPNLSIYKNLPLLKSSIKIETAYEIQ